ncbi:glycerol-3-phosphate 1-O-acyltransferase PlsY [Mitsuokella sp. AF21-1AC]|uniref:glycerol-3-phosphate 1-O-acyltransferase PlsY n=1 Tax=Mitsuokella sp. AF21-1AC TaxID=2292235 RepID=UPI000E4F0ABD|nr:glycerol-3-phosphate 1-O-acyltransferase PlsY [Mitsuokella sp. AF21-1AC]RGS74517.1 glycerol-3-phosphate 1-O-acyltransferase [Mitsuokella sp. AF21-1AC]
MTTSVLITCVVSYLLGSIPNGLVFGKLLWHVDLREHGSHNIGATNAWRTLGKGPGFLIFLLDFLKGAVSVYLAEVLTGIPFVMILAGVLAIVGHSCSLFLHFKGGKGVATGLGVITMLMPLPSLIVFLVWLVIVKVSGYVSLGSCIAAALVPVLAWAFSYPLEYTVFGVLAAAFIIVRHKSNIARLLNGTESKIHAGHRGNTRG